MNILSHFNKTDTLCVRPSSESLDWGGPGAVLNIGMNDERCSHLSKHVGEKSASELYFRFIQAYSVNVARLDPDVFDHIDVAIYKKLNIEEINGIIYMKGSYEEKQILDYLKQIFNDYSLKTKECSINQESNIHGVFRHEYFKELNFLCEE